MLPLLVTAGCTDPKGMADTHEGVSQDSTTDSAGDSGADTGTEPDMVSPGLAGLAETGARNVILIHADTLRQDRLAIYGGPNPTMPDSMSAGWLSVQGMYSTGPWTIPSTVSMLTHLTVEHHGVTHMRPDETFAGEISVPSLGDRFSEAGYATYIAVGNKALQGVTGFGAGFEAGDLALGGDLRDLDALSSEFLPWLDTLEPGRPFLIYAQPMDTHGPYDPRDPYRGRFSDPDSVPFSATDSEDEQVAAFHTAYEAADEAGRAALQDTLESVYDEQVLKLDAGIAAILQGLRDRGLEDDTLVVVLADHGETLNDEGDGVFGHGGKVRQELVHVPFFIHHPRIATQRLNCLSSNVDLGPTLYAALGIPVDDGEALDGFPLQDGCRTTVRVSNYDSAVEERVPYELLVTNGAGSLRVSCAEGATYRYNLLSDPGGLTSVSAEELPGGTELAEEMTRFDNDIRAAFGEGAGCEWTE